MAPSKGWRGAFRIGWALVAVACAAYFAHVSFELGGRGLDWFFDDVVYNGLIFASVVACLLRAALVREERLSWLVMGLGLLSWLGGELYWTFFLSGLKEPPFPTPGDALYLGFYPASYVSLVLLVRSRVGHFRTSLWLEGAIGALSTASIAAALAFQPIVDSTSGNTAAVATNLAYPVGDVVLLGLVVGVLGISGWRPGRAWILIGCGLAVMSVADGIFLVQTAKGTYVEGTVLDALWPAATLLVGLAAWQPARLGSAPSIDGWRVVVIPFACALAALGLITWDHFHRLNHAAVILTSLTLLLVAVRMALAFMENQRMLGQTRREALTDALTGLGNRRSLMADLRREAAAATAAEPRALVLFDLDGFKLYNDSFGHPAGDALLARLGHRLREAVRAHGRAYRLGGDEFCALVRPAGVGLDTVLAAAGAALSERGEGFSVSASRGVAAIPAETRDPTEALQLADQGMYAEKGGSRSSASRQARDVLLRALRERRPDLHFHVHDVAERALAVGRRLGMSPEELDELARGAELHDVGKVAIPDAILEKPGPLDEEEWGFMRRHTIIGENILGAAPALRPVAKLVRSSHERWDGEGYPDGLAGEAIPLGARVIAVCDAFDAMTAERPYRPARTDAEAFAELRRCAGTQFDPRVVEVFCATVAHLRALATAG